jgi:formylglycine-generating enzyme required for sulfatase activity
MRPERHKFLIICVLIGCFIFIAPQLVLTQPEVPDRYQKYIVHRVDQRSFSEKALNLIGISRQDVGRSFALIAGVSKYPRMSGRHADLTPAAWDIANLTNYLQSHEFFDEIVVLTEEEVTIDNLSYFLTRYFPPRLESFPKSRFLFAYSGHGMTRNNRGYLLTHQARHLEDRSNSIPLGVVREMFQEIIDSGHHVLALINSCYSGSFLRRPFGGNRHYLPRHPGAHAITAGGTGELAWHDASVGKGSIFFEKFFAGLDGRADLLPKQPDNTSGDGIVTVDELMLYLRQEVSFSTNQDQNPSLGDLSRHGSQGGLFFLNRLRQVEQGVLPKWLPLKTNPFGPQTPSDSMAEIAAGWFPLGLTDEQVLTVHRQLSSANYDVPEHWLSNTQPATQVWLDIFYLDTHEVTWGEFRRFLMATQGNSRIPVWTRDLMLSDEYPAVGITWSQAQAYCAWKGKRLPTEAEWEKAARTDSGHLYPWGDAAPASNAANFCDQCTGAGSAYQHPEARLSPVGSFQRDHSPYGIYDLAGSVREWVADTYATDYYKRTPERNPRNDASSEFRVVRGGSWIRDATYLPAGRRGGEEPDRSVEDIGFRCAKDAS